MFGTKYPFEYEVTPDDQSAGAEKFQRYLVRLKNIGNEVLVDLNVQVNLIDDKGAMASGNRQLGKLAPNEPETMSFQIRTSSTNKPTLTVSGQGSNSKFHWNSEQGEVSLERNPTVKEKIEARIEKDEEEYKQKEEAFDKRSKKTEEDVEEWMTGEANK